MKTLFAFYLKMLVAGASAVAIADRFINPSVFKPLVDHYGADHPYTLFANMLISRSAVAFYLLIWEYLVRKHLWKLFHPKLNLSGRWKGKNHYKACHIGVGPVGQTIEHGAQICQDCLSIRIMPTRSTFISFKSLTANLDEDGKLAYAYEVIYGDPPNSVDRAIGFEEVEITRTRGLFAFPTELSGAFYHCATGRSPIYSGNVVFERK